nr:hypothetical protein Iba_chr06cCG7110 [Ipomoea batatas]GMD11730.1 hypothetical protein Iba_chr06fCG6500 [Ipomoea batatas]
MPYSIFDICRNFSDKILLKRNLFILIYALYRMEMLYILVKNISRCQISTATKPPLPWCSRSICTSISFKIAIVEMQSWCKRVLRMQNLANPSSEKGNRAGLDIAVLGGLIPGAVIGFSQESRGTLCLGRFLLDQRGR